MISLSRLSFALSALLLAGFTATTSFAATTHRHHAAPHAHVVAKKKKLTRKPRSVHRATPAVAASKLPDAKRRAKQTKRAKPRHTPHDVPHKVVNIAPPSRASHTAPVKSAAKSATNAPRLLARCGFTMASRTRLFSRAVYIVDEPTHTQLYARNADHVVPIASVSKLMTAVVWLDQRNAPLAQRIGVTSADLDTLKFTTSRLTVGSNLTRADMLHIALMSSENRAAAALSRDYPGGRPAFVAAMNAKARSLGMPHTHFVNATGLSPQNVSTARELANLVRAADAYPLIRRYSTDNEQRVPTGHGQLQYVSSNRLVRYGRVQASVQKTGFINESGHNMVLRMMVHGRRPVIVTMLDSASAEGSRLDGERIAHWLNCSLR
ncbi:serine hydrolase [Paraburkholderia bannensis]|uniref:serine hydrolase n=1 Tax=Paraburkholderia bannensis TaxID=765414 RepID=UPI000A67A7D8|nr:serine hydrolase [Paraburkholderia bannensis]